MEPKRLNRKEQLGYACGMFGWSILTNIIAVMLIYFYVPPNNSGLKLLVPQITIFGILTLLSVIVASGRLLDAITDPLIAFLSDKSKHPKGRRIPFMLVAIIPSILFCVCMFLPLKYGESTSNLYWLGLIQIGFYISLTLYIIPYNALLPELAPGPGEKIQLSTWLSLTFVLGMIVASQTPGLADFIQEIFLLEARYRAMQLAIIILAILSGVFMAIPILVINESKHCHSQPSTLPLRESFRQILSNRNFLVFIIADFAYFFSLTTISSGMLYFVRVLLQLEESVGGQVMGVLVVVSLFFYPMVIRLEKKYGKRKLVIAALFFLGILLSLIFFMGKVDLSPRTQIFGFAVLAALPVAFLGILPYAIIAEIAEKDGIESGQQKEAMFFAVRNFSIKLGQTMGIMTFAVLTLFGKDPFDDLGIRLSAVVGAVLCILAAIVFIRFREIR